MCTFAKEAVYTHGHSEAVLRSHSSRTATSSAAYLLPYLKPDMTILDVGCGPGTISADLATYVPQGHITAMEYVADVLETARACASARGVRNISFSVGDAQALPFPDASFDVVHAHQVLQHVADPVQALREMRRVTRPGGLVAVRSIDFRATSWCPESPAMDCWLALYLRVARGNGGTPDSGRRLHAWAREAGFDAARVQCSASTWCYHTPEERAWLGGVWAERTLHSDFASSATKNGFAAQDDLQQVSRMWKAWAADEDGWLTMVHGEVICWV
ncbi:S-adenosyl-L-methionine-dependent methyltransferase [Phanerochaete sordida]|uniref:S-adenosyl-L-methionine-dependent methyltransferase n=1 Tax=Phanerochaete sordida TaxID=48140 RepID=A0A9P3GMY4_9APHY|nr:S-adenosyl-L-methionine-dependent methyltransferase [Phanerochaete sordida]